MPEKWDLLLSREFHMTDDSYLFESAARAGRLVLYEGKMVHQFDHRYCEPRYWVDEKNGVVMCLSEAADSMSIIKTHKEAHGLVPSSVLKVKQGN